MCSGGLNSSPHTCTANTFLPHPWHLSVGQVSRPQWAWATGLILTLSCTTDTQPLYALVLQDQDTPHSLSSMNSSGSPWYDAALSFYESHSAFLGNERKGEDRVNPMPSMGKVYLAVNTTALIFPSLCLLKHHTVQNGLGRSVSQHFGYM